MGKIKKTDGGFSISRDDGSKAKYRKRELHDGYITDDGSVIEPRQDGDGFIVRRKNGQTETFRTNVLDDGYTGNKGSRVKQTNDPDKYDYTQRNTTEPSVGISDTYSDEPFTADSYYGTPTYYSSSSYSDPFDPLVSFFFIAVFIVILLTSLYTGLFAAGWFSAIPIVMIVATLLGAIVLAEHIDTAVVFTAAHALVCLACSILVYADVAHIESSKAILAFIGVTIIGICLILLLNRSFKKPIGWLYIIAHLFVNAQAISYDNQAGYLGVIAAFIPMIISIFIAVKRGTLSDGTDFIAAFRNAYESHRNQRLIRREAREAKRAQKTSNSNAHKRKADPSKASARQPSHNSTSQQRTTEQQNERSRSQRRPITENRCCICGRSLDDGFAVLLETSDHKEARIDEHCYQQIDTLAKSEDVDELSRAVAQMKRFYGRIHPQVERTIHSYVQSAEEFISGE